MSTIVLPELPQTPAQEPSLPCPDAGQMLRLRRALPALILLAVAAALSLVGLRHQDIAAPHADAAALPATLGNWQMVASEKTDPKQWDLTPDEKQALVLDSFTQRVYRDTRTGREVALLFEYRRLGRGAFNHRPENCYPASGYTLTDITTTDITYDGHPAAAKTMIADLPSRQNAHQVLLYWFASGSRTESDFWKQQVEMAFGRLQPDKNGWAFVRIVSPCPPGDETAALAAEKDFVAQASPDLVRVISSSPSR